MGRRPKHRPATVLDRSAAEPIAIIVALSWCNAIDRGRNGLELDIWCLMGRFADI
jgi:hypothetical protein